MIRLARYNDLTILSRLEAQSCPWPWSQLCWESSFTNGHDIYVLEQEDTLIAAAVVLRCLDEAELLNIFVAVSQQRKGLGRRLLQHIITTLDSEGIRKLFLEVRQHNRPAQQLYQTAGFNEIGFRPCYYSSSHGREHAILMERWCDATPDTDTRGDGAGPSVAAPTR